MVDKLRCDWCGRFYKESEKYPHTCAFCGGSEPEPKPRPHVSSQSWTTFYKDWYAVCIQDFMMDVWLVRFYAGTELQAEIEITKRDIIENVAPGTDYMWYVEKRLEEKGVTIPDVVWTRIEAKRQQWLTN